MTGPLGPQGLEPDDIAHLVHALGVMRAALKASD